MATKLDKLKTDLLTSFKEMLDEKKEELESGIDEGIYDDDKDNAMTFHRIEEMKAKIKEYEEIRPEVFIFIDGGNIQGISVSADISVTVWDEDNHSQEDDQQRADRYASLGTLDEWNAKIDSRTAAGELEPVSVW